MIQKIWLPGYQVSPKPNRRIIVSGCSSASSPCFGACLAKINSDARRKAFGLGRDLLLWTSVFWAHIFSQTPRLYTIHANPFLTHPAHPVEFSLPPMFLISSRTNYFRNCEKRLYHPGHTTVYSQTWWFFSPFYFLSQAFCHLLKLICFIPFYFFKNMLPSF